jgi:hypothetical protein
MKISSIKIFLGIALLLGLSTQAQAVPITVDNPDWYEFRFGGTGSDASGCLPSGCTPSNSGNSEFVGDSPWTFSAAGLVELFVTDAFLSGDIFEVFDFGVSVGTTSFASTGATTCGSDPVDCYADANFSSGSFLLGAGDHSLTFSMVASPYGGGAAFFRVDSIIAGVPEPSALALLGLGLVGLGFARQRKQS